MGSDLRRRQLQAGLHQASAGAQTVVFANMFQFYAEDSTRFTGDRDLDVVRELNPEVQSLTDWLNHHKDQVKATVS